MNSKLSLWSSFLMFLFPFKSWVKICVLSWHSSIGVRSCGTQSSFWTKTASKLSGTYIDVPAIYWRDMQHWFTFLRMQFDLYLTTLFSKWHFGIYWSLGFLRYVKNTWHIYLEFFVFVLLPEHRHVGSTNFNLLSSRSHTIFTLVIMKPFMWHWDSCTEFSILLNIWD